MVDGAGWRKAACVMVTQKQREKGGAEERGLLPGHAHSDPLLSATSHILTASQPPRNPITFQIYETLDIISDLNHNNR